MRLVWKCTTNTDDLVVYQSGNFEIRGKGRRYGGGIRRDWELLEWNDEHGDEYGILHHGNPIRLGEAKDRAQHFADQRVRQQATAGLVNRKAAKLVWNGWEDDTDSTGIIKLFRETVDGDTVIRVYQDEHVRDQWTMVIESGHEGQAGYWRREATITLLGTEKLTWAEIAKLPAVQPESLASEKS